MADKRISQLIERTDIANNDVLPIVASGATTTNKVTVSTLQDWMQDNLDVGVTSVGITIGSTGTDINVSGSPITTSGNITINIPTASATNRGLLSSANWTTFNNKLSSVGLTMPSAFNVSNSPLTANGTIAVTGAGTVAQYIRGDGSLADFPEAGGGGASVSYYLNGSVSQGTIGGVAYYEMNKTPILGTGTDFVAIADGYLASFITDAGDPSLLEIPGGNWNFETYFSASSGGGSPSFYIELYKVDSGGTATLIASNSAVPELIAFGTTITPYFSTLAVPTTSLALTDRLALRYYVARSGRTITLHTENSHLCQIITTFTTGLTALNGLTAQVQNFATGTSGTDFNISSASSTHTFNLPDASASNRGVVTTGTQTFAGYKIFNGTIGANVDIQLATQGTALNTFIKNINATGQTSIGSNGFGFNNANNIYFSGSSKGGGIIAFSNTGNQTYTLQDASGTLAFTSDLNSYLPLTGGTLTGTLGGTAATFSGTITAQSSAGSGLRMYGSSGTNQWDIYLNSTNLRISDNTGTGNIVFDRPLNGTSASLSSTLTATKGTFNGTTSEPIRIERFVSGSAVGRYSLSISSVGNFSLYDAIADSDRLIVNQSTGAATFSSSVTTGGNVLTPAGSGLAFTGDTSRIITPEDNVSGALIQTPGIIRFNAGGTSTRMTITASGNVGIGTASPGYRLDVLASSATDSDIFRAGMSGVSNGFTIQRVSSNFRYVFTDGKVGIGTASPVKKLQINVSPISGEDDGINVNNGTTNFLFTRTGSSYTYRGVAPLSGMIYSENNISLLSDGGNITFHNSGGERMRITSLGELLWNVQGLNGSDLTTGGVLFRNNSGKYVQISTGLTTDSPLMLFYKSNGAGGVTNTGSISTSGNLTLYNTTSDYRLKEDLQDFNALEKIANLKIYDFAWKHDQSRSYGVLAHELAEVLPYSVFGEKDAIEEDEEPKLQQVDYSKIVPILIKAIQELKAEIDSLKTK